MNGSSKRQRLMTAKFREFDDLRLGARPATGLEFVPCRGRGCRERLARIMGTPKGIALRILAPIRMDAGVIVLEKVADVAYPGGLYTPGQHARLLIQCGACSYRTTVDIPKLRQLLGDLTAVDTTAQS